ncbi:MAG TPA: nucleotide exchange factor GrpE [Synergistaceae bacterium]|jgi:molecular chaperone GrpE|uniref:nucleotide exchange factor GrpE n=1 Tax=Synergistaceae TaxID=649777 RepID=UPI000EE95DEF|nr:nucleotide exchange factor GrpE [Synergistaceae bacterium DZ-S4]HAH68709.1 nucleotide exchange factor GrpE [Synergistaceae bacterium]HQA55235.1 nucleotide exchange factor GrpE [Synergistaceae bacterium]
MRRINKDNTEPPLGEERVADPMPFEELKVKEAASAGNDTAKLTETIEEMKREIKSLTEEAARARADYYNLRTRVERDREKNCKLAAERSVEELLPVFENLERVCCAVEDEESNLYKGIMMVTKQFYKALENLGLESIETEGDFDPSVHEAVSMEPVDDESRDGCIIGTLRKGYRLAGRIIRAPQVRVGKYTG